ncbi:MAG: phospho-N-acetylmuramoyl-pentapeptide-transferase [Coriobacteriia bacterium]|nr:phospho-N-acetylmuramoyl-pentapeptide-transferase [Coriobacteriia bacterium]MCL2750261.1 phospho-N-acetylmuramoyl-pentapeptide-transferase [Coriobacteriia bacterium]
MFGETMIYQYPTFLVFLAIFIAMALAIVLLPIWIRILKVRQIGQQIRADGPQHHYVKQGTPTMGGVVILIAVLVATLICCGLAARPEQILPLILLLLVTLLTGFMGLVDDLSKVIKERSLGLRPNAKMICLTLISVSFCLAAVNFAGIEPTVTIPFIYTFDLGVLTTTINLGGASFSIPWIYLLFVFLLVAGMSNAVNLVDGLDGLAGGAVMIAMIVMAAIAYRGDQLYLALFAAAVTGACVGFLWFNAHPASIFMGDTSSLALGAAFAALAVLTKSEFASLIIGGIFILEALSVMIQVGYYKLTKKRVFLMAPLHHHFEQKGWGETKVVIRFWIITALLASLGFALYFAESLAG